MDLYIIGAGDVGGFMAYHANQMGSYNIQGFLDDNSEKHGQELYGAKVIGGISTLGKIKNKVAVVIAIANPASKKKVYEKIRGIPNIVFPNFIHPSSWIGEKVVLGEGCIIYPNVSINFEAILNNFVIINMNAAIGHNCEFGDFSTVSPSVSCGGFTKLGSQSFLGIGASTLQSTTIGNKSTIGAGAVIIKDIPDNVTVVGNPGKIIK